VEREGIRYLGFEPQLYRVPGGEGLERCLAFTEKRTEADLYLPRDKTALNDMTYRVNRPVDEVRETIKMDFERFGLSVKDTGLLVDLAFTDRYGRHIEINVDEQHLGKAAVFKSAIAPASLATHTDYFPLIILSKMSIANRRSTVSAKIDGVEMDLFKIPVLGSNLIIFGQDAVGYYLFLSTPDAPARVHRIDAQRSNIEVRSPNCQEGREGVIAPGDEIAATYQLEDNAGYAELSMAAYHMDDKEVKLEFRPPIPALLYLRDGAAVSGRFAVSTESTPGMMIGSYEVHRAGPDVTFSLHPEKAYQPVSGDLWVRAYRLISVLHLGEDLPHMESHWEKKQIINDGLHVTVVD